jgi:hypothetical protein
VTLVKWHSTNWHRGGCAPPFFVPY